MLLLDQREENPSRLCCIMQLHQHPSPNRGWHSPEGLVSQSSRRNLQELCPRDLGPSHVANLPTFQELIVFALSEMGHGCHLTPHTVVHSGGIC